MLIDVGSLAVMGVALGGLLGYAAKKLAVEEDPLEQELQAMLPGSQCGQCGFVGCSQFAAALAKGEAPVTGCVPGGKALAESLAGKLGIDADLTGHEDPVPQYAEIREDLCIGCLRCIAECSTDAIVGAPKHMHTVVLDACHGCGKCFAICPTEAIKMCTVPVTLGTWHWDKPNTGATASANANANANATGVH
ncbi:RnfABCDGE type electron transport complex subunit B [Magnetospirillum sp. UT-4]|uniref:RnfABCDGE type electron transport complex subunit B n=1 Tax=Magnetospirillum sp. UT-4 TaxID=2681467 RepID=UPI0013808701|nr:RnfABCDGE type electron transport complex subunit B [Magnetospirillum sp. UT-4]CAA7626408.1 putative iron-sulfur protein [Magnetospirillum sp. UT-4]